MAGGGGLRACAVCVPSLSISVMRTYGGIAGAKLKGRLSGRIDVQQVHVQACLGPCRVGMGLSAGGPRRF